MLYDDPVMAMPDWRKSSFCYLGTHCVQVAALPGGMVGLRNSRDPGTVVRFTADEWIAFAAGMARCEFARVIPGQLQARPSRAQGPRPPWRGTGLLRCSYRPAAFAPYCACAGVNLSNSSCWTRLP